MKKFAFVLPLITILALAYWRYTYILNPNFAGDPWLINIRLMNRMHKSVSTLIMAKSIIIFWVLFFMGNMAFFAVVLKSIDKSKMLGLLFVIISVISASLFVVDGFLFKSAAIFSLAAMLKNFILSPVFTVSGFLMIKNIHLFENKK